MIKKKASSPFSFRNTLLVFFLLMVFACFYFYANYHEKKLERLQIVAKTVVKKEVENEEEAFQSVLFQNQFPLDCKKTQINIWYPHNFGFGSDVFSSVFYLSASVLLQRTFMIYSGDWVYAHHYDCPHRGFTCYFEPHTNCTERDIDFMEGKEYHVERESQNQRVLWSDWNNWKSYYGLRSQFREQRRLLQKAFPSFQQKDEYWFCSQLIKFLLKPNQNLRKEIEKVKTELKWSPPIIGMHVRLNHGEGRKNFTLEDYMDEARKLRREYGVNKIYVSTDHLGISSQLEAFQKEFEIYYRKDVNFSNLDYGNLHYKETTFRSLVTFVDLFLLAESDFFVGTFSSNFGVLATSLGSHKKIASLDGFRSCLFS